jgi:hypothetical protein
MGAETKKSVELPVSVRGLNAAAHIGHADGLRRAAGFLESQLRNGGQSSPERVVELLRNFADMEAREGESVARGRGRLSWTEGYGSFTSARTRIEGKR